MRRVFVTGSTTGLGRAAAVALLDEGHEVVLHARNRRRAEALQDLSDRVAGIVVGDLESGRETRTIADQVNQLGPLDAVIHNAGIYIDRRRVATDEGHSRVLAVNVLAPYLLTALIERPARLVYLSSGMHRGGDASLRDLDWTARGWNGVQAYSDSKLLITTLAVAIAERWHDVLTNAVDPGWVPTRMGGPGAPDDLVLGHVTQVWLATSDDTDAMVSGEYWFHQRREVPELAVHDGAFQSALLDELVRLTGVRLP